MNEKPVLMNSQAVLNEVSPVFPVAKEYNVAVRLKEETEAELRGIRRRLLRDNPFIENARVLQLAENYIKTKKSISVDQLEQDLQHFESLAEQTGSRIDKKYWLSEIGKLKAHQESRTGPKSVTDKGNSSLGEIDGEKSYGSNEQAALCRALLLQRWRTLLEEQTAKWELETIQDLRRKLLNKLKEWLEKLQVLADTLDGLSIEPGLLFDLAKDNLSLSDVEQLKKWVSFISEDKGVRELCDLMGRLSRANRTNRQELVRTALTMTGYVPDVNSREEIVGVYWGMTLNVHCPRKSPCFPTRKLPSCLT